MFTTGFTIFLGVGLLLAKLPRLTMLRVLKYDLMLDIAVTLLVLLIHWGTLGGTLAASVAGLMTSIATSAAKRWIGYIEGNNYHPGRLRLAV